MKRDVAALSSRNYDVLVVGGGIHGLTVCADLSQRGLSVALVDRADFGSGSSFNHLRTIHGGLRYLQAFELARARESVRERRTLARIAPFAVKPLPFALPLYRSFAKGKLAMRAGFLLDRIVAGDRNQRVPSALHLPAGRVLSRARAIERFPGMRRTGLTGAAIWHDYTMPESDRLTAAWMEAGVQHGAVLANYVEATAPIQDGGRIVGVRARDLRADATVEIRARLTINAAGAGADVLPSQAGGASGILMLKAMNLVTRREAGEEAIGARSATGRYLFLVPWRRRAIFGTWESAGPSSQPEVSRADVSSFIDELNVAFPSLDLRIDDVTLVHRGLVPAMLNDGAVALEGRHQIVDHVNRPEALEGLLTVAGTKYTTARAVAERVADRALEKLRMPSVPCRTADTPLPGGKMIDLASALAEARRKYEALLPSETLPHLLAAYGARYEHVLALANDRSDLRTRIGDESPVIGAELVWAVRREMAVTLSDAVVRRTPLGALGYPGDRAAERSADIIGAELEWTAERRETEIEALRRFYKW
jgi:glycerol-3-phosphate dehydrogenase